MGYSTAIFQSNGPRSPVATTAMVLLSVLLFERAASLASAEDYALLIAVGDYDVKELRPLRFTRADVLDFHKALIESGISTKNIVLMHDDLRKLVDHYEKLGGGRDPKNYLPSKANVTRQLELLLGRLRPEDSVIVAMAGHGVQFKGDRTSYFCPTDSRLDSKESLISFEDVYSTLKESDAGRKLLLVDACQNDPQTTISRSRSTVDLESVTRPQNEAVPEGIIALFSCKAGQKSFELPELGHGVFFYHLLDGWKGKGDLNHDGKLSYRELATYTEKQTSEYASTRLQVLQTPQLRAEFSGDWVLRRFDAAATDRFGALFNGVDLKGWRVASGSRDSWRVEDGELVVTGERDAPGWLMTEQSYSDYTLRLEYRLTSGANSGLTIHADPFDEKVPEIQLLDDSFEEYAALPNSMKSGAFHRLTDSRPAKLKSLGEWNRMEIDVRGRAVTVSINGETVTTTDFVLLTPSQEMRALARSSGRIGLQSWVGGTVRFRKIEIREHKFSSLFNGRDLSGWIVDTGEKNVWSVGENELVVRANETNRGWLMSEKDYANIALRFEFKVDEGANSGVTFRAARGEGDSAVGATKLAEIQLQDDNYAPFARQAAEYKTGSLFAVATTRQATAPTGQWNDCELEVIGPALRVTINGILVNSLRLDDLGAVADRIPALRRASGRIGFQGWLGNCRFRNIRLKEFDSADQ